MDRLIRRKNVRRFCELLRLGRDEPERQRLQQLLDEERLKQMEAGDPDDSERQIK